MSWKDVHSNEEGMEVLSSLPNLDKRIKNFLEALENEPCSHHAAEELSGKLGREARACDILSNSNAMCPACRLRLYFFHTVFNGGAYDPSLDE